LLIAIEMDRPRYRRYAAGIYLRHIFAAMIDDPVKRHLRGGKLSRTSITSTMDGFLHELADHICGTQKAGPPPNTPAA
jgi:hypothetical protein